jgi:DNA-binding SARP family transcriptional activator
MPRMGLVQLQLLGPPAIRRPDMRPATSILTQPRPLAVLAYLVLARPRGLHSRDTLTALLWPEYAQARGRHALRNALHAIRLVLGDAILVRVGDGLVGVEPRSIECDALQLDADLAAGRLDDALARHEGELLQGFHVSGAPAFERWLDVERARTTERAASAATASAREHASVGDLDGAIARARRACALLPDDERLLRSLLELLVASGERASATRAFTAFADRLRAEYDAEPSAETRAVARGLRTANR